MYLENTHIAFLSKYHMATEYSELYLLKQYKPNMPKCSYPVEVVFSGSNLEMILGYAQVHLSIADDGESFFSVYQMTTILHSDILK